MRPGVDGCGPQLTEERRLRSPLRVGVSRWATARGVWMRFLSPAARHARTTIGHGLVTAAVLLRAFCFYKALGSASDHREQFVHVEGLQHEWRAAVRQYLRGDRHPARRP